MEEGQVKPKVHPWRAKGVFHARARRVRNKQNVQERDLQTVTQDGVPRRPENTAKESAQTIAAGAVVTPDLVVKR
jgi:hypothetical protein